MKSGLFNRRAIYNEIDPFASEWLRRLCSAGHITPGEVIEGDITKLTGADIRAVQRFHAFAGIGVWDYALRLAGWPDVPVWTGSCPCQPFSVAGKHKGTDDLRHLWPQWFRLIGECRPPVIFGEQVASPLGRAWLDNVSTDLETLGYAVGAADLCAAGVGAPHIRQRLFFCAYADNAKRGADKPTGNVLDRKSTGRSEITGDTEVRCGVIPNTKSDRRQTERQRAETGYVNGVDDLRRNKKATQGFWGNAEWAQCSDGKYRPSEPGVSSVVNGFTGRLGQLRAYGNAIVPQVAATFIEAALRSIHHEFV